MLGGIIIGLLENIAQYVDSEYLHWGNLYEIAPFYVLIIILAIRALVPGVNRNMATYC